MDHLSNAGPPAGRTLAAMAIRLTPPWAYLPRDAVDRAKKQEAHPNSIERNIFAMNEKMACLIWLTAIAATSIPLNAGAADWELVAESLAGPVFIDRASVAPRGMKTKAWFVYNYKEPRQPPEIVIPAQYSSMKQLVYFDCTEKTSSLVQERKYREAMGAGLPIGVPLSNDPDAAKFVDVEPGTVPHAMLDAACLKPKLNPGVKKQ